MINETAAQQNGISALFGCYCNITNNISNASTSIEGLSLEVDENLQSRMLDVTY